MSLAVTYWEGWVLAHPAPVLIFVACAGTLAVLAVLMHAENRRDDRHDGLPPAPRRGPRSRARGTRARRRALGSACRRARAALAGGTSWGRRAIALRIHGITIEDLPERPPAETEPDAPERPETPPNACEHPETSAPICSCGWPAESPEPARLATGAERAAAAPWYAPETAAPSPWEHQTMWFSLDAIDADIRAREAATAGGDA